ncbi:uncharacterized protein LOC143219749 [Lasioglossum baleicum]|uniref:uncharacterized protein LOC143219749 n=1 Tax=Lasioglossum baleicum TaxID=434251 RepID=UPI003FCEC547
MNTAPSEFKVTQLKDILKARGLSTIGVKQELINRLMEDDPSGSWIDEYNNDIAKDDPGSPARDIKEMEVLKKEKELAERGALLAEREIQLLKREVEMIREMQRLNIEEPSTSRNAAMYPGRHGPVIVNEAMKAMLNYFDGNGETFDAWERQLTLLRATYGLDDNTTKLLAVSRLKNQALEWFHSKPEHVGMTADDLVKALKDIFGDRQNRIAAGNSRIEYGKRRRRLRSISTGKQFWQTAFELMRKNSSNT